MKILAGWLYALSFLFSFVMGGPMGLMYLFPFLALLITALWFVVDKIIAPLVRWIRYPAS